MGKRIYNILFHTHTVSGIVISAGLYVIFFTGSFSFFRDEIVNWERNHTVEHPDDMRIDFDATMDSLSQTYDLYGREINIYRYYNERRLNVSLGASADTLADEDAKTGAFFYLDTESYKSEDYYSTYTLGEFLYRLHFFAQIPYPYGYFLSGFVAFFFLFAIITGVLVHWDKIIKNFFLFRPRSKLKTIWTDAHTTLGLIGLPFQFVYAVTGAFFMLNLLLVAPSAYFLYDGDQDKLYDELEYNHPTYPMAYDSLKSEFSIDQFIEQTRSRWDGLNVSHVIFHNYGDANMHITVEGRPENSTKFAGVGEVSYKVSNGAVVSVKDEINSRSYLETVKLALYQLHFGDYGGMALRVISFVMGLIGCFVILSGVMIWLVARERKDISEKQKKFNRWVGWIYLAVCLSLFPVTALAFIAVKWFGLIGTSSIYSFYFISWLFASIFFAAKKDNAFTNKYTLISGGILGLLIPMVNGFKTGNWPWVSFPNGDMQVFFVDLLWIILSLVTLMVCFKLKPQEETAVVKT